MNTNLGNHISQQFNNELEDIRNRVLLMGGLVEQQLTDAIRSLLENDQELAEKVIENDKEVNDYEVGIDEECTTILARRQPAASDLRLVITVIKTIADLERIGDESKRIARMVLNIGDRSYDPKRVQMIRHLCEYSQAMLHDVLDAFARMDTEASYKIYINDRNVDKEYEGVTRQTITYMMEDPRSIPWVLNLMWVARALERIGDRATNIAEYIIFFVKGKDVRHTGPEGIEKTIKE